MIRAWLPRSVLGSVRWAYLRSGVPQLAFWLGPDQEAKSTLWHPCLYHRGSIENYTCMQHQKLIYVKEICGTESH